MKYYTNKARQAGMTLIELTVVLLVLVGLSGLLIPYVQGFIDKTHDSANADSLKEVSKQIQEYNALYSGFPEDMDSLIDDGTNSVIDYLMQPAAFSALPLATAHQTQLNNAGIARVMQMLPNPGAGNYTFAAVDNTVGPVTLAGGGTTGAAVDTLAIINPSEMSSNGFANCSVAAATAHSATAAEANKCLEELLGKPAGTIDTANMSYVAVGIGNNSSLIGRTMSEAPVHFAKVGGMNAGNKYNRILAVYEVKTASAMNHMYAEFMGTVMPMMKLEGMTGALSNFYKGDGI